VRLFNWSYVHISRFRSPSFASGGRIGRRFTFRSDDGQTGNYSGPEVGFGEIAIDLPQTRLNEALAADAFACPVSAVVCERIRLSHKENTYDPPSQNDARRTRAS
jgi:hypothetical protein